MDAGQYIGCHSGSFYLNFYCLFPAGERSLCSIEQEISQFYFEAQSKIFLNATQYLISGNKDLAIKEFLNAVNLNRETIETYFALGGLFVAMVKLKNRSVFIAP